MAYLFYHKNIIFQVNKRIFTQQFSIHPTTATVSRQLWYPFQPLSRFFVGRCTRKITYFMPFLTAERAIFSLDYIVMQPVPVSHYARKRWITDPPRYLNICLFFLPKIQQGQDHQMALTSSQHPLLFLFRTTDDG